ncbi:uncharacterized protein BO80DRAFT_61007 [Aspergillus ibericus CBS 121593]|uniref:Uncharacterized protein n=1 Tax=Aspergillus ibericus CBS 121593 TaxID=1448316 RepID=A0A395H0Y4_9EURO|nr:hypothetical protein BO80DRAFT_61007 [Aspergillus ibericus CBS 121593]RAL01511.1 hypothetical protein BO80DRAFT_61007 [Aspergillus ibericus CBS 121593]
MFIYLYYCLFIFFHLFQPASTPLFLFLFNILPCVTLGSFLLELNVALEFDKYMDYPEDSKLRWACNFISYSPGFSGSCYQLRSTYLVLPRGLPNGYTQPELTNWRAPPDLAVHGTSTAITRDACTIAQVPNT